MTKEQDPKSYEASVKATQAKILEGVQASQQWVLEQVRAHTEAAQRTVQPVADTRPATPDTAELQKRVDEAFDFTQQLLASQREFTHQLVAASAGGGSTNEGPASGKS